MQWVLLSGVAVVLILGLAFIDAYRKRSRGAAGEAHRYGPGHAAGRPVPRAQIDEAPAQTETDAAEWAQASRRMAEAEAESIRVMARREADSTRREAAAEASSLLRSAHAEIGEERIVAEAAVAEQRRELEIRRAEDAAALDRDRASLEGTRTSLRHERDVLSAAQETLRRSIEELTAREDALKAQAAVLAGQHSELTAKSTELTEQEAALTARRSEHLAELERISGLTAEEARAELMAEVQTKSRREAAILARGIEAEARAEATTRARAIVVDAVQRVASEQTTESVVSVLHLPSDEMKGRIIGREGRNIRAFESVTGVNVIIDDTPEAVLLSCFDPVRRETGRLTLEKLISDGRIHPQRIEEIYETSKGEVDELCLRAASDALAEVGLRDVDERLMPTLGRLRYRTSYGQNVLAHLIESAHIAGLMAAELGLSRVDAVLVKRAAFLHDIGKALTHEVEGSHAIVGAELLRSHGEDERVAHAVEAHHNEVPPKTIEAVLTQAADACSAARPGARRESLESYVKRLERIEAIASAREGVERVWAMQAGREVRVMVRPETVDDLESAVIAREVAKQIEDELTYPGQIRVTVVRETRSTEVAH